MTSTPSGTAGKPGRNLGEVQQAAAAAGVRVGFDPAQTALLVIDPVNDFLSEGGAAWEMTNSTVKKNNVVGQLQRVIAGARTAGVPVCCSHPWPIPRKIMRRTGSRSAVALIA